MRNREGYTAIELCGGVSRKESAMKKVTLLVTCSAILLGAAALLQLRAQTGGMAGMPGMAGGAVKLDTAKIESLTGLKGTMNDKEGVFKVSYPRNDIQAKAAGVTLTPAMGLT